MIRLSTYDVRPADVGPPYWVAMGAAAITALAGLQIASMTAAPAAAVTWIAATVWAGTLLAMLGHLARLVGSRRPR